MTTLTTVAAILLCAVFQLAAWNFFFHYMKLPPPPKGSPAALFMEAVAPTGYLKFVIILEIIGSLLVLFPSTRILGLLILGPIVVNILCYHGFLLKGAGLFPLPLAVTAGYGFLFWTEWARLCTLLPAM